MSPHKIARVHWQTGQMLLPEHFQAQDGAFSAESLLTAELTGLPLSGIGALELNRAQLTVGTFALTSMTALMPGGHLVQVPGNATVAPFSLEQTGRSRLPLFLHLMNETRGAEGLPLYAKDPPGFQRALHVLKLSMEQVLEGALSTLALAVLTKNEQGKWALSREHLPPLLRAGPHPFLEELLFSLDKLLDKATGYLCTTIRESFVRGDRLSSARRALCEVRRVQGLRLDMGHGLHPPTYHLFELLRRLYFEMCCYLEYEPEQELPAYKHDEPGPGLWRWMALLDRGLQPGSSQHSYQPFNRSEGRFLLSPLPWQEPAPNEFYLLVQRHERDKPRPLEGVKLASPLRLPLVWRQSLKGLMFRHLPHPSFLHSFESDIDWYQIMAEGEEWQAVLREDGLALPVTPSLEGAPLFLFWRRT